MCQGHAYKVILSKSSSRWDFRKNRNVCSNSLTVRGLRVLLLGERPPCIPGNICIKASVYSKLSKGVRIPWEVMAVLPGFHGTLCTRPLGFGLLTPETLPCPSSLPLTPGRACLIHERNLWACSVQFSHVQTPFVFKENLSVSCSQTYFQRQWAHFPNKWKFFHFSLLQMK